MTTLTRAPLLRRIIKIMKVSNQSCSTIVKQVLRRFHHFLPLSWVMSTIRHGQRLTQSEKSGKVRDYLIMSDYRMATEKDFCVFFVLLI